jgi:MFS family permease
MDQVTVTDRVTERSVWWGIGGSLFVGLFVAYLDRSNLSVGLPAISRDMGFAGPQFGYVSSWALTIFLIGYAVANVLGGILTRSRDPKPVVIWCVAIWSVATVMVGFTDSVAVLLVPVHPGGDGGDLLAAAIALRPVVVRATGSHHGK